MCWCFSFHVRFTGGMQSTPFPGDILSKIRKFPGNDKCCDCPSLETNWASVNHGTLLCLECAGKHRGLGVNVSFVRSIHMDAWSQMEVSYSCKCFIFYVSRFLYWLIDHTLIRWKWCYMGGIIKSWNISKPTHCLHFRLKSCIFQKRPVTIEVFWSNMQLWRWKEVLMQIRTEPIPPN